MTTAATPAIESLRRELSGRFAFVTEIARGRAGVEYLATDLKHERWVSVNVLPLESDAPAEAERVLDDLRAPAAVLHPHILPLIDSGSAGGSVYTVTPYVEGESLRTLLRAKGRLGEVEALRIAAEIASALARLHESGLAHGDLRPENILFSSGQAMLADIGVARAESGSGSVAGDLRALSTILREMLAGDAAAPLSPTASSVVEKAFASDPARPLSAVALRDALVRAGAELELAAARARRAAARARTANDRWSRTTVAEPERASRGLARLWPAMRAAAALLLVGLTLGVARPAVSRRPGADRPTTVTIAVLPLDHLGTDAEAASLSEGLSDEIQATLSATEGLRVPSRTSATALTQRGLTAGQLARTLHASYVLEGSVQRSGSRVRTLLRLVDARTDATVWVGAYERALADVLRLRAEIGRDAAAAAAEAVLSADARR